MNKNVGEGTEVTPHLLRRIDALYRERTRMICTNRCIRGYFPPKMIPRVVRPDHFCFIFFQTLLVFQKATYCGETRGSYTSQVTPNVYISSVIGSI